MNKDHSSTIRFRANGHGENWGVIMGIHQVHVLNDVRSPTLSYFEVMPWHCRRGRTVLPVLQEPALDTPTLLVRPRDVFPDCVLFLDVIDEDQAPCSDEWATHNLIQIDPLDLPTYIGGVDQFLRPR